MKKCVLTIGAALLAVGRGRQKCQRWEPTWVTNTSGSTRNQRAGFQYNGGGGQFVYNFNGWLGE